MVSAWFCASESRARRDAAEIFADTLRASGVPLQFVDCAFGDEPHTLPEHFRAYRVRSRSVLWQKERMLNLASALLPSQCTKVVWIDADVLFENPEWLVETSSLLEHYAVVQPFASIARLPRGEHSDVAHATHWESFASVIQRDPDAITTGSFGRHGHTGFAWAARRELLHTHGLYDACVAGRGDHLIAHAFGGDWESECVDRIVGGSNAQRAHAVQWCERVYEDVRARIGVVPGTLLHLWHGDIDGRGYRRSLDWLRREQIDPARDLVLNGDGAWEWHTRREERSAWMREYLSGREAH